MQESLQCWTTSLQEAGRCPVQSSTVQSSPVVYIVTTLFPLFFHRPQAQGTKLFIISTLRENPVQSNEKPTKSFP